jgi:four helix bundle protein
MWPKATPVRLAARSRHHLRIAIGSLAELDTQLELAERLRLVEKETLATATKQLARTRQLLHGLARSQRRPANSVDG